MRHRIYSLYLSTYREAGYALSQPHEEHTRRLCESVANRSGLESMLAMMAMSDAETGRRPRSKAHILGFAWTRRAVAAKDVLPSPCEHHAAPARAA
jgi:hypothetical protein